MIIHLCNTQIRYFFGVLHQEISLAGDPLDWTLSCIFWFTSAVILHTGSALLPLPWLCTYFTSRTQTIRLIWPLLSLFLLLFQLKDGRLESPLFIIFYFICIEWSLKDKVDNTPVQCRTGELPPPEPKQQCKWCHFVFKAHLFYFSSPMKSM